MPERKFLFICGAARSGTSALWRLVSSHPRVAIGIERYIRRALSPQFISPELFEKERFFSLQPGDTFYEDLRGFNPRYAELERRYDSCLYYGDKVPRLYEHYDRLCRVFDAPKILFIVRNAVEVASSYQRRALKGTHWSPERDYKAAVLDWNRALAETRRHARGKDIHVVEFESIFSEESEARRLFAYLALDWCPEVAEAFSAGQKKARALAEKRESPLSSAELRHVCLNADFESYKALVAQKPRAAQPASRGKYQEKDRPFIDYGLFELQGTGRLFRGPPPARMHEGGYLACLGGAQTFGRYVERPYPALLAAASGLECLNLGYGGGKPALYLQGEGLLDYVNRASAVVVQLMSARALPNSRLLPAAIDNSFLRDTAEGEAAKPLFANHAYARLLRELDEAEILRLVEQTRQNYVARMRALLERIRPPKILFWFSVREARYTARCGSVEALMGDYPHFVTAEMLEELKPLAQDFVSCVSREGLPQLLVSRPGMETQQAVNAYYPSPRMHELAASALLESKALEKAPGYALT